MDDDSGLLIETETSPSTLESVEQLQHPGRDSASQKPGSPLYEAQALLKASPERARTFCRRSLHPNRCLSILTISSCRVEV